MATEAPRRVTAPVVVTKQSPTATGRRQSVTPPVALRKGTADASVTCAKCGATSRPDEVYRIGHGAYEARLYCGRVRPCQAAWPDFGPGRQCALLRTRIYYNGGELARCLLREGCERAAARGSAAGVPQDPAAETYARCGGGFGPSRVDARYCSPACRQSVTGGRSRGASI